MQVVVRGKNYSVPEQTRARIQDKISRLSRHLETISDAEVEVSREKTKSQEDRYVIQATLRANGTLLRAQERGADVYKALDQVVGMLDRQIERFKGRSSAKLKGAGATRAAESEAAAEDVPDEPEEMAGKVVRTKRFRMKPMTEEEAVEQMELLAHDFFVFHNSTTNTVNVLYKREDGNYGLIVPELG